jgi:LacI family transcriptional regulator
MAVRMKDIASALGVSTVTVSKVLNNNPRISETTRQRVLACAERLQYKTNLAAKGLATGQSKMVGFIVPEIVHGFFSEVAAAISDYLRSQGYGLIISSSRDDASLETQEIQQMMARRVDAIIIASCELKSGILDSIASEIPVIFLDRRSALSAEAGFVGTDDRLVGEIATQHLLDIGCRRIAYMGGPDFSPAVDRELGYRAALKRAAVMIREQYIVRLPQNEEATHTMGMASMKMLLKLKPRPDGVFCYNDAAAYGAMMAIFEANLRVPQDVAIVGCGNLRYNIFLRVPLTSVDQDTASLGREAAKLCIGSLRSRAGNASLSRRIILVKPTLVVRASTIKIEASLSVLRR